LRFLGPIQVSIGNDQALEGVLILRVSLTQAEVRVHRVLMPAQGKVGVSQQVKTRTVGIFSGSELF
jgi:hypothetical protein